MAVDIRVNQAVSALRSRINDIQSLVVANASFDSAEVHLVRLKINESLAEILAPALTFAATVSTAVSSTRCCSTMPIHGRNAIDFSGFASTGSDQN